LRRGLRGGPPRRRPRSPARLIAGTAWLALRLVDLDRWKLRRLRRLRRGLRFQLSSAPDRDREATHRQQGRLRNENDRSIVIRKGFHDSPSILHAAA
jgi:hypothetical protein